MRNGIIAALLLAALAACATEEHYERILAGWVGRPVDQLILDWRPPDKSATLSDGRAVIEYDQERTFTTGGYTHYEEFTTDSGNTIRVPVTEPKEIHHRRCATRFIVSADRIIRSWSHDGDDCVALPPET